MADYSPQELLMLDKYYGDRELHKNDLFWIDCLINYQDKVVPLPLIDNHQSRRRLKDMLDCPPGQCSACCRSYVSVPLTEVDVSRLESLVQGDCIEKRTESGKTIYSLPQRQPEGCQFLKDGACSIYPSRPDVCMEYPIQYGREAFVDGKPFTQITYRLRCQAGLNVIRRILSEAAELGNFIAPDLSLVPRVRATDQIAKLESLMRKGEK